MAKLATQLGVAQQRCREIRALINYCMGTPKPLNEKQPPLEWSVIPGFGLSAARLGEYWTAYICAHPRRKKCPAEQKLTRGPLPPPGVSAE